MSTRTRQTPAKQTETAPPTENPRTVRSRQKLEEATTLIQEMLKGGDWVNSKDIHQKLRGKVSEGMFGRVKAALNIEHRRIKDGDAVVYQWRIVKGSK